MPKAHVDLIKKAVGKGIQIEGYSVAKPTMSAPKDEPAAVERVKVLSVKTVADLPDQRYDEREWRAVWTDTRKSVGMRTVCDTVGCGSFTYHRCNDPRAMRDQTSTPVSIIPVSSK